MLCKKNDDNKQEEMNPQPLLRWASTAGLGWVGWGGVPPMGADGLHPQQQIGGGSHLWVLPDLYPQQQVGGGGPTYGCCADDLHPQQQIGGGSHLWVLCWGSHPWVLCC